MTSFETSETSSVVYRASLNVVLWPRNSRSIAGTVPDCSAM